MKKLSKIDHLKIYSNMLKIRRFEERSSQLYGMGHIGGFCHLYIGQEAVVVGVLMTIKKNDSVVTTYRDHGHMIARGLDVKRIMSELTGRANGYSAGKGGSMHMFSKENNFYLRNRLQADTADIGNFLNTKIANVSELANVGNLIV